MELTSEQARHIEGSGVRCTTATLLALGVEPRFTPRTGSGVAEHLSLRDGGPGYTPHCGHGRPHSDTSCVPCQHGQQYTLRRFVRENPTGRWVLATSGHSMALVDGVLVDTEQRGPDGRRMLYALRVNDPKEQP